MTTVANCPNFEVAESFVFNDTDVDVDLSIPTNNGQLSTVGLTRRVSFGLRGSQGVYGCLGVL